MYNVYNGTKLIASFSLLKESLKYVSKVVVVDLKRQGYELVSVTFPRCRRRDSQKFIFGRSGRYVTISIAKF